MLNIAIDGVAGAGKSSVAAELAKRLNIYHFNTGLIYRAIACEYMLKFGDKFPPICDLDFFGSESVPRSIKELVKKISIDVKFVDGKQVCIVNGSHVFDEKILRHEKTSAFTPNISTYFPVRDVVRRIQRKFALENNCVMEGRDIGRVVLPNASYKFFLTATVEERALRRYKQLNGQEDYKNILNAIEKRDFEDKNRKEGALIPAHNSIIIDTTEKSFEEVVSFCLNKINEKMAQKL